MTLRAETMAFEKRYLDDSGVEYAARLKGDDIEVESCAAIAVFPIERIDWLIEALERIRHEVNRK